MTRILEREIGKKLDPDNYEKLRKSFLGDVSIHGKSLDPQFLAELGFPENILDEDPYQHILRLIERYDALCQKSFLLERDLRTLIVGSKLWEK